MKIKISKDFSYAPGPRYKREGENSGEKFREEVLLRAVQEAIRTNQKLTIDLDGAAGYGRSFLEESFGGLIRVDHLNYDAIMKVLEVVSKEQPFWRIKILEYLKEAHEHQR
jgi:hypothetical protein